PPILPSAAAAAAAMVVSGSDRSGASTGTEADSARQPRESITPALVRPEVLASASRSATPASGYGRPSKAWRAAWEARSSVSRAARVGTALAVPMILSRWQAAHCCGVLAEDWRVAIR